MTLEAIIFDMDGVLIDSEKFYMESEQLILKSFGIEVEPLHFRKYCGTTQDYIWSHIKEEFDLTASVEELKKIAPKYLLKLFKEKGVELIPGVRKIITELSVSPLKTAVASSTGKQLIKEHLTELDIVTCFDTLQSGEEVANSKPAPDVFLKAAEVLGVKPENCLVIEDSRNGVLAAKAAGMTCIGFNNLNYPPIDIKEADEIITDMSVLTLDFLKEKYMNSKIK